MDRPEVDCLLQQYQIPISVWGQGVSKTINHLYHDVAEGEVALEIQDGKLIKKEKGVGIDIYFHTNGKTYKLEEARQEFVDGRVRERKIRTSLGEKMKPGETPVTTARRALNEELGFANAQSLIPDVMEYGVENRSPTNSKSYPGLVSQRTVYTFTIDLPEKYYQPKGYMEIQPDKTTYFIWNRVDLLSTPSSE
jgi:hypothetical protein